MKWWAQAVGEAQKSGMESKERGNRELWAVTVYFYRPGLINSWFGQKTFVSENSKSHYSHKYPSGQKTEELDWKKISYAGLDLSKTNYIVIVDSKGRAVFEGSVDQLHSELQDYNNNSGH